MRNFKPLFGLIFFITSFPVHAQEEKKDSLDMPAKHAIKINLLQPFSYYSTVPLAYEMRVAKDLSLTLEAGYVYNSLATARTNNKRGVKLRTELRWYPDNLSYTERTHDYLSVEPYGNMVNFDRRQTVSECLDAECQYRYSRTYDKVVRYRESGIGFKWGHIGYGKNFLYDVNLGLRLRRVRYYNTIPSTSFDDVEDFDFFSTFVDRREKNRYALGLVMGFSFGWRIK